MKISIFVLFISALTASSMAGAQSRCAEVFAGSAPLLIKSLVYDPFLLPQGQSLMPLDGRIEIEEMNSETRLGHRWVQQYQDPISGLRMRPPDMREHSRGLEAIYDGYGLRMSAEIVRDAQLVELSIPVSRTSSAVVYDNLLKTNVAGFMRVFDGGAYSNRTRLAHEKFMSDERLPLERIAALQGRIVKAVQQDRQAKRAVFEIGKFFVSRNTDRSVRGQTKIELLRWLKRKVLDLEEVEHTVYYVDVATEAHRRMYEKEFGFLPVLDPELNGNLKPPEYILRVDQKTLAEHLEKIISQPR